MERARRRGAVFFCLFAVTAVGSCGCNAIFGIDGGEPAGRGAESTTGSGSGGPGGSGGGPTCDPYDGSGSFFATAGANANLSSTGWDASGSAFARHLISEQKTEMVFGGSPSSVCNVGTQMMLSGKPVAGDVYTVVDAPTFFNFAKFHIGKNAYVMFNVTEEPCNTVPVNKTWNSIGGPGNGSLTIEAASGTMVSITVTGVVLEKDPMTAADGTMTLDGGGRADCFFTEP